MSAMERLEHADAIARLRGHDVSLFGGDAATAASVSTRLGWTDLAASAQTTLAVAAELAADARTDGVTDVVLLGMGGSSLASLVIGGFLGGDGPALHVLDTVSPITVRRTLEALDPASTLYLIASKSGGTIEPNALYAVFRDHANRVLGEHEAGRRFIALTDPDSALTGFLFLGGMRRVRTDHVAILTYVEPVSAVVLAAIFLGEPLTAATLVGGVLVVAGGVLVARIESREAYPLEVADAEEPA